VRGAHPTCKYTRGVRTAHHESGEISFLSPVHMVLTR
jgi:hypothetical protein